MSLQVTYGLTLNGSETRAWDETFYANGTSPDDGISAWVNLDGTIDKSALLYYRLLLLSSSCSCYYIRSSLVGETDNKSRKISLNLPGLAAATVDDPQTGPLYLAHSVGLSAFRQIHLRGVPDAWVENAALTNAGKKGVQGITQPGAFLGELQRQNQRLRFRNSSKGGASSRAIVGATKDGQYGLVTLILESGGITNVGDLVDVVGLGRQPQARGTWKVAKLATGSGTTQLLTLRGSERVSLPEAVTGRVVARIMATTTFDRFDFDGVRSKKTGKKKYLQRGKQSAKLIRR